MSEKTRPPIMRTNRDDINIIFGMFAGMQELDKAANSMEKRFRSIPNGWRDLKMLIAVYDRLIKSVIRTIPPEKCDSMMRMLPRMRYKVTCSKHVSQLSDDECIMTNYDANVLTIHAHEHCKMCFEQDCRKCVLGKTLDSILTYDRDEGCWANIDIEAMLTED